VYILQAFYKHSKTHYRKTHINVGNKIYFLYFFNVNDKKAQIYYFRQNASTYCQSTFYSSLVLVDPESYAYIKIYQIKMKSYIYRLLVGYGNICTSSGAE